MERSESIYQYLLVSNKILNQDIFPMKEGNIKM